MLKINNVEMPSPKPYTVSINDIDGNTNRNADAIIYRDRIAVKRKLSLEWGPLTQNETQTLLNAVSSEFFTCEFLDPQTGTLTKTMYVGDRSTATLVLDSSGHVWWNGLKMDFIEQ